MSELGVYYDSRGCVLLECEGAALELTRAEAEALFVDLGHVLKDMDYMEAEYEDNDVDHVFRNDT